MVLEIRRRSMGLCVLHHVIKTTKHLVAFGNNTLVWFLIKKQSVCVFLTVNDGRCMYLSSVLSKCIVTPRGFAKLIMSYLCVSIPPRMARVLFPTLTAAPFPPVDDDLPSMPSQVLAASEYHVAITVACALE